MPPRPIRLTIIGPFHAKNLGYHQGVCLKVDPLLGSGSALEFALQEGYLHIDNVEAEK